MPRRDDWPSREGTMHPSALHASSCSSAKETTEKVKGHDVHSKSKSCPGPWGAHSVRDIVFHAPARRMAIQRAHHAPECSACICLLVSRRNHRKSQRLRRSFKKLILPGTVGSSQLQKHSFSCPGETNGRPASAPCTRVLCMHLLARQQKKPQKKSKETTFM